LGGRNDDDLDDDDLDDDDLDDGDDDGGVEKADESGVYGDGDGAAAAGLEACFSARAPPTV